MATGAPGLGSGSLFPHCGRQFPHSHFGYTSSLFISKKIELTQRNRNSYTRFHHEHAGGATARMPTGSAATRSPVE
jgi:hypothetical protein